MAKFAQLTEPDAHGVQTAFQVVEGDRIEDLFHPDLVPLWRPIPDNVEVGWTLKEDDWSPPSPAES